MSELLNTSPLGVVRRFEAAGFRAWPAASVHYDRTWIIRLTAGHPAKRLNSVNPLDPGDILDIDGRIERAARRFEAYGRPLVFRMSPLAGEGLTKRFDDDNWDRFSESLVMMMPLNVAAVDEVVPLIPLKDVGRYISATIRTHERDASVRPGLTELVDSIEAETGLFAVDAGGEAVASALCVHDGQLAGLFEIATLAAERGKGHGRRIVLSAMRWARARGARIAWLQVEADNEAAIALYHSLGFTEAYRYHYRCPPGGEN
ncbi:MAG: GNAT family N-acetyltransferase [Rhizobiaceae bacterium]|nr:GNAT family N-acetyltransferase [Rhizobiaceae bacterium]